MKTAEQIAYGICGDNSMITKQVIKALREYGEAVRQRAAAECQAEATCEGIAQKCAAAIERMPLP